MQRIAIIGIGCRFPGRADDVGSFWSLLAEGRCALGEIPGDRWALEGFHDATHDLPDRAYAKWGGFLDDIRSFDPAWFGLSPREAEAMDPQQRLLLQVASEAVADARLPLAALRRGPTGVFIGVSNVDYGLLQRYRPEHGDIQAGTGTALSIVANRVSNRLDLSGPSMGIDTACSSSLVALDTACRHLGDGSCEMALAGGVNILLDPRMFITFSSAHMLSPTGRIRAFDAAADGFVRGEGVGVVLLRRLDDAVAAGDRIYAVIEATAVNQDGRTGTITEPSLDAQIAMLQAAVERAGIEPESIAYVEAHGTGTPVGDPIEAKAIGTVLGGQRRRLLPMGSAKTNIGHLEPAAGIAGLIKAALVLHLRSVPPSLGFEQANPAIQLDDLRLTIPRGFSALDDVGGHPHALVNSFGFGGTNACAVLSAAPESGFRAERGRGTVRAGAADKLAAPIPVPLSAPTARHLQAFAAVVAESIESGCLSDKTIEEITSALAAQRDPHEHRAVIIATTPAELVDRLRCLADGREWPQSERHAPPQIIRGTARADRKVCFTMTGQGGQWWAMGRELIECEPVFRRAVEAFDAIFAPVGGWSVMKELMADEATSRIDDAAITPAVMFAFQTALAEVWKARGVAPDIVLGHSFGEVTAAFLAGGIEAAEVARLVDQRGLIRHRVDRVGTMAAIGLGAAEIAPLLPSDGSIEIGGYNAPSMVTLSGEEAAIDVLIARLNAEDPTILTRKLALDFAYHSSWFEPVEGVFKAEVGTLATAPPRLPVVSTVTGQLNNRFDTDYWWQNLRQPVRYQHGIDTTLDLGADVFVELGPHRTLSSMTAACAAAKGRAVVTVTTLDRRWGDLVSLAVATGQLWVAGVDVDWTALLGKGGRESELPRQPWLDQALWIEPDEAGQHLRPAQVHPLLGRAQAGPVKSWRADVSLASHGWLSDHRLDSNCVYPAAAYIEMLTVAARDVLDARAVELADVTFPAALFIGSDDEVQIATHFETGRRKLSIHSRVRGGGNDWTLRAAATVSALDDAAAAAFEAERWGGIVLPLREAAPVATAEFYAAADAAGYGWGPQFQGLKKIERARGAARGVIAVAADGKPFHLDPRLVDSALQLMLASGEASNLLGVMPTGIARLIAIGSPGASATALGRTRAAAGGGITADIEIAGEDGSLAVRIEGLSARRRARPATVSAANARVARLYEETSERAVLDDAAGPIDGAWVVIAGNGCGFGDRLAAEITQRGGTCTLLVARDDRLPGLGDIEAALGNGDAKLAPRLIYAVPISTPPVAEARISQEARKSTHRMIEFGRALGTLAARGVHPAVTVLTLGARTAGGDDVIDERGLAQSPVLAVTRTIMMELPEIRVQLVDCDPSSLDDAGRLVDVMASCPEVTEIAVRDGVAFVLRIDEIGRGEAPPPSLVPAKQRSSCAFALVHTGPPGADGLDWRETSRRVLEPNEIEVEVAAAGLNFRDLMAVSGLLPLEAEPDPAIGALGLEVSGVVTRVGADVRDTEPGQAVLGMGRGVLRRHAVLSRQALHILPPGFSHEEAATVPSAFLTAHYALAELARLQAGETVLIHSATGGVGLAAIQLARRAGADIIATAGSPERRALLFDLGIFHIFDSRSARFADDVMRATGGRGVDIVLNSLSGPMIGKGIACLAPHGRFIELGKRDVYDDTALGLKALKANISLHVVDVAALIVDRPQLAARLLGEVTAMLQAGEIAPLPHRIFKADDIADAFRHFSSGQHVGKIVVSLDRPPAVIRRGFSAGAPFDGDATYLVTGGTRGFGRAVGQWLAERGAGRVVLASRSGRLEADTENVRHHAIETLALDVTSADAVERAIADLAASAKPLRGIFHAAVEYDDALLADMTEARTDRVLAPKIDGALNLTRAVLACGAEIDQFVMFSSLAQVVGWPGQSNYAAANGFLEALAHRQRSRGIPGQCINWGALGESGHVARSAQMQSYLDSSGWIAIDNRAALDALARALDIDRPVVTIAAADWSRLGATQRAVARSSRLASLLAGARSAATAERGLSQHDDGALEAAALYLVRRQTARVLRAPVDGIVADQTLAEAGIDSLSSFELHNRIEQEAGIEVPMARYTKARRIGELAQLLVALVMEARSRAQ